MEYTQGVRFDSLSLLPEMARALEKKGIMESTPIQAGCIGPMREWKDVIAKAPTGTGKTFAFGIPIIEHIEPEREETQAVILAPTRELAMQITDELRDLCAYLPGIRMVCLYGGAPIGKQIEQLKKKPQIIVATPGRLGDHLKRRTAKIDNVDTEEITIRAEEENKPDILQYRIDVDQSDKVAAIARIIRQGELERVIVFCNTKGMVERLKKYLEMEGLDVDCIHGDIPQKKREQVMARFRRGELPVFIATDVAARGIDVDDVDAVFNYDVPQENEYYVHRIGRTGRAKRRGIAFTLVSDYPSKMKLDEIIKVTGSTVLTAHFDENGQLVEGEMAH